MTENEFVAEIERLTADRDLEKKWRKDAEDDREALILAAKVEAAEQCAKLCDAEAMECAALIRAIKWQ